MNGNLRTVAKTHEMIRREIAYRIAQARVQAFKVSMVNRARDLKEENMVRQFYQRGMELCRAARDYTETQLHMSAQVDQVLHRLRESGGMGVDVSISLVYHE